MKIREQDQKYFQDQLDELGESFRDKKMAVIYCEETATGTIKPVLCRIKILENGNVQFYPEAILFMDNPFNLFEPMKINNTDAIVIAAQQEFDLEEIASADIKPNKLLN